MKARRIDDGPWAWVSKHVVKVIEEAFDESDIKYTTALSVYVALCLISSDMPGQDEFRCGVGLIVKKSGVGKSRVHDVLSVLEKLRVVHVLRVRSLHKHMKEVSRYTLLPDHEVVWSFLSQESTNINPTQISLSADSA